MEYLAHVDTVHFVEDIEAIQILGVGLGVAAAYFAGRAVLNWIRSGPNWLRDTMDGNHAPDPLGLSESALNPQPVRSDDVINPR